METARHRLEVYFAQTMPLIEYYHKQSLLREIDGMREITQVTNSMLQLMGIHGSHA
jgi:adenylate kinase